MHGFRLMGAREALQHKAGMALFVPRGQAFQELYEASKVGFAKFYK